MYRYLTNKTPDYTTTRLTVIPQVIMPQVGEKRQVVHEFDDGSVSVVGVSSSNYFTVELQWNYITTANQTILMDFWHSETKGAGRRRTFYWLHPVDGLYYVVRFMSPLTTTFHVGNRKSISSLTLRVEGLKAIYWTTAMTDYWAVAMTDYWETPMTDEP